MSEQEEEVQSAPSTSPRVEEEEEEEQFTLESEAEEDSESERSEQDDSDDFSTPDGRLDIFTLFQQILQSEMATEAPDGEEEGEEEEEGGSPVEPLPRKTQVRNINVTYHAFDSTTCAFFTSNDT
jgi:hypothetical protein